MKWIDVEIFGHQVKIAFDENSIHVYNAFPVKDDLKKRGYRWNPNDKSWFMNSLDASKEILALKGEEKLQKQVVTYDLSERVGKGDDGFPDSYSVLELRNYLDEIIKKNTQKKVWVRGVVASEIKDYEYYSYFDLRDEGEQKQLFFKCDLRLQDKELIESKLKELNVSERLEKDLPVFIQVEISLSLRYSVDIRLKILDILPEYTKAKLRSQLDITIDKLTEEGILENQRKLKLPKVLSNLGLITSEKGTSRQDILAGLNPYQQKYSFYFIDSRMEGGNAVSSVISAIKYFKTKKNELSIDGIIIARGGGSEQSLSVFNDLSLCRVICKLQIPVITAIGHEKDISAIELCSHLTPTPSTPSGVGKFFANRYRQLKDELIQKGELLINLLRNFNIKEEEKVRSLFKGLVLNIKKAFKQVYNSLDNLVNRFNENTGFKIRSAYKELNNNLTQFVLSGKRMMVKQLPLITKILKRLDFNRLLKRNLKGQELIGKEGVNVYEGAKKLLKYTDRDLHGKIDLLQANHPEKILKKGFTLTYNLEEKVIKSKQEFDLEEKVRIKFYDGLSGIVKKE